MGQPGATVRSLTRAPMSAFLGIVFDGAFLAARPAPAAAVFSCSGDPLDRLAKREIAVFIAEHGVTAVPIGHHAARSRCGDQPRKEGERYANGRLKWKPPPDDKGHEMTVLHREELVGIANAHDPRASYVIGQLELGGKLVDRGQDRDSETGAEQSKRRHDAAVRFAKVHFWLFGPGTAPSHMKNLLTCFNLPSPDASDDDRADLAGQFGIWVTRAKSVGGYPVLERAAIYDVAPSDAREEAILRNALDAITGEKRHIMHHAIHGDLALEPPVAANDNQPPMRHRPRRGLPVMFGAADRPDPAQLADAISRFKAGVLRLPVTDGGRTIANDNEVAAAALAG